MKNLVFRLLAVIVAAVCTGGLAFAQTHITDRAGLEAIKNNLSGSYVLDNDIDLSGSNWDPLGDFKGTLDGNGHVISNMTINKIVDGCALFGTISGSAVVKNLGFENASVTNLTQSRTAIVAGYLKGGAIIENCYIANSSILARWCVGSFAGRATDGSNAIIRNCYSSAVLSICDYNGGAGQVGGIIGNIFSDDVTVENCYFSGAIQRILGNNPEGQVSGIVGWNGKGGPDQANVVSVIRNNVNLSPYLLSNYGKHRITSAIQDQNGGDPTGPNYSLSTTVVSGYDDWGNTSAVVSPESANYGENKKDGANIPNGDANAKTRAFYETTLGWNFTDLWTISEGASYPYFAWAKNTTSFVVVPVTPVVSEDNSVDLAKYIFSGRGRALTFTVNDSRVSIAGSVITLIPPVDVDAEIDVTVQEAALAQTYALKVALEATKSKNANLASITLSAGQLTPAFDPAVTSYKVLVPQDVTSITSTAAVADALSNATGDGTANVSAAATQTIKVTADYGNTKEYVINYVIPNYISNRTELAGIADANDYMLTADIDLSDANWTRLANFSGILDGAGHVISNLTITGAEPVAFFHTISGNAVVRNLGFEKASVTDNTGSRTAVVTGFIEGSAVIENCYVANSTINGRWCVGSFAGRATNGSNAIIRNCYSSAVLSICDYNGGAGQVGGIIGNIFSDGVTVENCYFSGAIQRILGNNPEGQVSGIVGWNGKGGPDQANVVSVIRNNVNLSPYLLSNYGKHRITSAIQDQNGGDPTGPNYSLSTTVVSGYDDWGNTSAVVSPESANYGENKKDGANIPNGDANAKSRAFYETTLGWDFTSGNGWAIDNSYPHFQWADQTRPHFVVVPKALSLTSDAPIDLSKYIFSGRGLNLTFSTESDKITLNNGIVSLAQAIAVEEKVAVLVQEGALIPTYSLEITLIPSPSYDVVVGTFTGGEVTADKSSYKENEEVTLTISPSAGYELESISAYKTGDPETSVALAGESAVRTFVMPAYGVTITASFTAIVYDINYNLDGGTNHEDNPATYTIEDTPITLQAPTKDEYTFAGWSPDNGIIPAGSTGDKTFTAQWTAIPVYALTIGTFTGGEVTAGKSSYKENEEVTLTISPSAGYELESISAYKTGDSETSVALAGAGNVRTFVMPAYGVTITAVFRDPTAIPSTTPVSVSVTAGKGEIKAAFEGSSSVKLYSITGLLLDETVANGSYTYRAQPGIYILSVDSKAYKVIVK